MDPAGHAAAAAGNPNYPYEVTASEPLLHSEWLLPDQEHEGWPVGGIRAHAVHDASATSTPQTPKIAEIVANRVRTEREIARERSASKSFSSEGRDGPGSSRSQVLSGSSRSLPHVPYPIEEEYVAMDDANGRVLGESRMENTGLSSNFVTRVEVEDPSGEVFTWTAREHRRNKLHDSDHDDDHDHMAHEAPFTWFDWERILELMKNPIEAVSFAVGPIFFLGSAMFVFGCSAQEHVGYWEGLWPLTLKDWLVNIPFLVGALLFFIGCYFAVVETANVDFEDKWHQWLSGQISERPTLRFSPLADEDGTNLFLSYYGCLIQFFGSIVFLIGATSSVLGGHGFLPEDGPFSEFVLVDIMFFIGGLCFAVGAFFLVAEGTHSWWRGLVPPLRQQELESLPYWIGILNWVGSVMFFGGGIQGMISNYLTTYQEEALTSVTWLGGSVLFAIQGILLYLEMINPSWKAH